MYLTIACSEETYSAVSTPESEQISPTLSEVDLALQRLGLGAFPSPPTVVNIRPRNIPSQDSPRLPTLLETEEDSMRYEEMPRRSV